MFSNDQLNDIESFGGGGAAEIYSRLIGQHLTEMWGQTVLADPRPGANGIIATEIVARAPADGYTLLAGVDGTHTINPSFYRKLPYDAVKDFAPITQLFLAPLIVSVHPSIKAGRRR
jgi:tripartite-type tricarboxylate transporter receptor subunit TctC